jgi:hypothetical protein
VLIGESGTEKELLARLIHTLDRRSRKRDLIVVDCGAVVPDLLACELYGNEAGAYTGPVAARDGGRSASNLSILRHISRDVPRTIRLPHGSIMWDRLGVVERRNLNGGETSARLVKERDTQSR